MNTLYCINCGIRTPRNFADERIFDGIYCELCAPRVTGEPPRVRLRMPRPADPTVWESHLENLKAGALGDPGDPETLLRYWKAQEAAGYPRASENVQYFKSLVEKSAEVQEDAKVQ